MAYLAASDPVAESLSTNFTTAPVHHTSEVERTPVGQADAAVRLGLTDLVGLRCAMDAVGGCREIDPDQADRIVRARFDG